MKTLFSCHRLLLNAMPMPEKTWSAHPAQEKRKAPRAWQGLASAGILSAAAMLAGCASLPSPGQGNLADADRVSTPQRERAQIRLSLAMTYFENQQYEVALDEAGRALDADPSFSEAYSLRGLAYSRLGEKAKAEASFRRAIELRPNDVDARHNLGVFYCQNGQLAQAVAEFQQAVSNARVTDRGKSLLSMGICQARLGDRPGAEQSLKQAYELDPGDPMVSYNLALLLYQRGVHDQALAVLRTLNNSQYANAESMWLGIRAARKAGDGRSMRDLGEQLRRRFASSKEYRLFQQGVFDD